MWVKFYYVKWLFRKLCLWVIKWVVWFMIVLVIGGVWVFYFIDVFILLVDLVVF